MANEKPTFTQQEKELLLKAIDAHITSYLRAQKQRPEFAEVSRRIADDLNALLLKIKGIQLN